MKMVNDDVVRDRQQESCQRRQGVLFFCFVLFFLKKTESYDITQKWHLVFFNNMNELIYKTETDL